MIFLNIELPKERGKHLRQREENDAVTSLHRCTPDAARWVHRPSVPSPRAPAASDVIVRPPSHPGFHENNDVTVSGP